MVWRSPPLACLYLYNAICLAIQVLAGLSTLFGLYATVVFSLTTLYGKAALGVERDREYDLFIRKTVRSRVHGFRCYILSLGTFALEAFLVLIERTYISCIQKSIVLPVAIGTIILLYNLWRDARLLMQSAVVIKKVN